MVNFKQFFILLFTLIVVSACAQNDKKLNVTAFQTGITSNKGAIVLDVRTPGEFQGGHLATAVNINYNSDQFAVEINKLDKTKTYYVYCTAGVRSARAATLMRSQGFPNVLELKEGLNGWQAAKLPVEK